MPVRAPGTFLLGVLCAALGACAGEGDAPLEGRPSGPYRMTLAIEPAPPRPATPHTLTTRLTRVSDGRPVQDLQVVHERVVHNFIVGLDFESFAHIHHEDFAPLTADDLAQATFRFPYTFPRAGHYRMVSEFTHRDRGWLKQFDFAVGTAPTPPPVRVDLARTTEVGPYRAALTLSPRQPVAGFETELVLTLTRGDQPVTDLALLLGSEVHVALWRIDGEHFGHAHSYTPHMAAMLAAMHDRGADAATRARRMAAMMVEMMNMPAELVFPGPRVPVRVVFPAAGTYVVFLQAAPGGTATVFRFMLEVAPYREGTPTAIESMVTPATDHAGH